MAKQAYVEAAMQHETAAKAHRTAAEHHDKGGHAAHAHSTAAHEGSARAHTRATAAHGRSAEAAKQQASRFLAAGLWRAGFGGRALAGGVQVPYCVGRAAKSGNGVDPSGVPSRPVASIMATVT